jgi:N-acetylglucosamine kinase-like BadF-type ATPase
MSRGRQRASPLAVGVDLGGTWIRAAVLHDGRVRRRVRRATALRELGSFVRSVVGRAAITSLVVAARSVWTERERSAVRRMLRGLAQRVEVVSDVEAALLGALDGRPGILVLVGTGSIVLGRDGQGRVARAGGLGPLIGDEGSAFWLGREWLRLTPKVAGIARALARRPDAVARVAAYAPMVLSRARRGDPRARAIAAAGQEHLAALAGGVVRTLQLPSPVRVSWSGSVAGNDWYRAGLRRALARRFACRWQTPVTDPALAAARLASRRASAIAPRNPAAGQRGERCRSSRS